MSLLEENIELFLNQKIQKNELPLPSLPKQAIDIMAQEDEMEEEPLIDALKQSAAISFSLLALANLLNGKQEATSHAQLIAQLGLEEACTQASRLASEQMIQPVQSMIDKSLRSYTDTSIKTARIAASLAAQQSGLSADFAFLAGLFCRIGVLPVIAYANDHEADIQDSLSLEKLIQSLKTSFSVQLLEKNYFDAKLVAVAQNYANLEQTFTQADYISVVQVASLLAQSPTDFSVLRGLSSSQVLGLAENTDDKWQALIDA